MDSKSPFPLQADLKRLKPQIGGVLIPIATLVIFVLQGPLKNIDFRDLMERVDWALAATLIVAVAVAAFLVSEVLLKRIYFNRYGIGLIRPGATPTWFSFDELKDVRLSRAPRYNRRGKTGHTRMTLIFHTGTVRIYGGLYDKTQVEELNSIVEGRKPSQILPTGKTDFGKKNRTPSQFMKFPGA